jgi:geranylgeranyl diphosphate synthase, type II
MVVTHSSSLADCTRRLGPQIEAALDAYTDLPCGCPARLREAIRYSLLAPGKRLRPMLALLAGEACGGTIQAALPAACSVEMVHAYSLIHDDLPAMDDDDLRRGRPTCHKVFGEAVAILAGDALLALAFQILAGGIRPPTAAATCCAVLAEAAGPAQLVGGQADDLEAGVGRAFPPVQENAVGRVFQPVQDNGDDGRVRNPFLQEGGRAGMPILQALESIHNRKTGAMIRASLRLGGIAAGADEGQLAALDQYAARFGLAFQVTDDLLDVRSDEATTGKRVNKDAAKGKLTYPGLIGIEESAAFAAALIAEACEALAPFGPRGGGLAGLARYVIERNH